MSNESYILTLTNEKIWTNTWTSGMIHNSVIELGWQFLFCCEWSNNLDDQKDEITKV